MSDFMLAVRYSDCDQMGIAHHSRYAVWFEEARTAYLKENGYTYAGIEKQSVLLPLTDLKCSYKKPAKYGETVRITTRIAQMSIVRLVFAYEVYDMENGLLLATGETHHAWTDRALRPISIAKKMPELYDLMRQIVGEKPKENA